MGTVVTFDLFDQRGFHEPAVREVFAKAAGLLHGVDEVFSTWKPNSPLSKFRRGDISLDECPDEVREVLDKCAIARELSGGWFDPWSMPGGVDPTGYVKGWAAQGALSIIARLGAAGAVVNAAGDVAVTGTPSGDAPFQVGIVNPFAPSSLASVARVRSSIATSGDYERGEHLLDPFSGNYETRAASSSVTGPDLGLADALATALVIGGDDVLARLASLDEYEGFLIRRDHSWTATPGFEFASPVSL